MRRPRTIGFPAAPEAGKACLHQRLARHPCKACTDVCPTDAITLRAGRIRIDSERCLHCGRCLFVCPVDAPVHLPAPQRTLRNGVLIAPFTAVAPVVEELLMWHREKGVRAVEMDMTAHPGWAVTVAALNLRLVAIGEPRWVIVPPASSPNRRRHWLRLPEPRARQAAVSPGRRARRRCFAALVEYQPVITPAACTLCGACVRICPEAALGFTASQFNLRPEKCTGCQSCVAVCFPRAIALHPANAEEVCQHNVFTARCQVCHQPFRAWHPQAERCVLCRQHPYGMRGG